MPEPPAAVDAAGVFTGLSARWAVPAAALNTKRHVYRAGDDGTPPRLTHKAEPEYTEEAREAKLEGVVVLRAVVETDGRAREIEVLHGLGMGLDENAIAAVRQCGSSRRRKPASRWRCRATIEVDFRLPAGKAESKN